MRIKILKINIVLLVALFTTTPLLWFIPGSYWWVSYIVTGIVAALIHTPISKWIEDNKDKIPK